MASVSTTLYSMPGQEAGSARMRNLPHATMTNEISRQRLRIRLGWRPGNLLGTVANPIGLPNPRQALHLKTLEIQCSKPPHGQYCSWPPTAGSSRLLHSSEDDAARQLLPNGLNQIWMGTSSRTRQPSAWSLKPQNC